MGDKMNPWVKRKWVRALRSGKYGKAKSTLGYPVDNRYCCLGVLVCEMAPEFVKIDGRSMEVDGVDTYLPDDLTIHYGLSVEHQHELGSINDRSATFDSVISYIEANL